MVKVKITEQYLQELANSIRTKNNSNQSYYPSEMASAILNIPTGSTGLHLDTTLTLISDTEITTTGEVTLQATLEANYDDITPTNLDFNGFLKNAPVFALSYCKDSQLWI